MMIFTNVLALVLALAPSALFAAPTPMSPLVNLLAPRGIPTKALQALENGVCDLSAVQIPTAPTPLPVPGAGLQLAHVAIGRGVQNYTCATASATDKPVAVGAIASLFNATCSAARAPTVLSTVTVLALNQAIPTNQAADYMLSGHHEFTAAGAPLFLMDTGMHKYGFIQAKKNGTSDAPATASKGTNGLGSVPWLKLVATEGDFKEVYRLNTAGGVAPKTCEGISGSISVAYAAEYWFYA